MKKSIYYLFLMTLFLLTSCLSESKKTKTNTDMEEKSEQSTQSSKMKKADSVVNEAIEAHGGERYHNAFYSFEFRKKKYTFRNNNGNFKYTVTSSERGTQITDILNSGTFKRFVNDTEVALSKKDVTKYSEALNSVIYFALLPYKLNDKAVNKTYIGKTSIKGENYDMVGVNFDRIGGGNDHNDEFLYWFNTETHTMDYLAYSYETNGGGVRFRSAYKPRTIDGIRFQDYINYEASLGTPLHELSELFENGKLKELSRIETENIVSLEN
ncbi:DUF6503 family protein [Pareuzebyella sediminis]|uniref:DUF6503 family protein n=1 Tax=Pareuzebyella sediminis TaxID=2607998 RepID=UPI0011EBD7E0|nr:DUF6503 family protein [Pareuzebyella sediminis]